MKKHFKWAVIGAGPAGIASVAQLIEHNVAAEDILWLDPEFNVGDVGKKWGQVPSNTKVSLFIDFLKAAAAFDYTNMPKDFALFKHDENKTCLLQDIAEPLRWVTNLLKQKVTAVNCKLEALKQANNAWHCQTANEEFTVNNVILAYGCEPKSLSHPGLEVIPLATALHPEKLAQSCQPNDKIAVFGSSHSAMLIIRNLLDHTATHRIVNFFLTPLRYAVYLPDMILFDNTGLKGTTADWARATIDGNRPEKLHRYFSSQENINAHLPECNKVIYSVGFEARRCIIDHIDPQNYDDKTGIIAPGLFGCGIAFPEGSVDKYGHFEHRVGMWKFMEYLQKVIPLWLQYPA